MIAFPVTSGVLSLIKNFQKSYFNFIDSIQKYQTTLAINIIDFGLENLMLPVQKLGFICVQIILLQIEPTLNSYCFMFYMCREKLRFENQQT